MGGWEEGEGGRRGRVCTLQALITRDFPWDNFLVFGHISADSNDQIHTIARLWSTLPILKNCLCHCVNS